jgi:pyruvate kinase
MLAHISLLVVAVNGTTRQICAEAKAFLKANGRPQRVTPALLAGLVNPITEATVDAACLAAARLDAPLLVIATESGRTALALSNRRSTAAILALTRTEAVVRLLAPCWGVTPWCRPGRPRRNRH